MRVVIKGSLLAALAGTLLLTTTAGTGAQTPEEACQLSSASSCWIGAAGVSMIQPRIGTALWGGNAVPGTASTLGMRIGSFPRVSGSGRVIVAPTTLPPTDGGSETETAWITGISGQGTMALLAGMSPWPTVGGVLSLDVFARLSLAPLPGDKGFNDDLVWGGMAGLRLGLLRESFTLPGVSVSGAWGRSTEISFGDQGAATGGGYWEGGVSDLNATLAVSKRLGALGFTAGAAWDRYASDVRVGGSEASALDAEAVSRRWSGFVDVSWTLLIFHAALEAGWQESPEPAALPGLELDPTGWWGGFAFRVSI